MKLLRKVFCRQTLITLLAILLVLVIAVGINLWGIRMAGDIQSWERWLSDRAPIFFIWRMMLYGIIVYGWLWMRKRVLLREPSVETRFRLRRIERCTAASILLLETTNLLAQG